MWLPARSRGLREVALLLGTAVLLLGGSRIAQQRQVPPRVALDLGGYLLLVLVVVAVAGRTRWPRTAYATAVLATGGYLALGYSYGPIFIGAAIVAFTLTTRVSAPACFGAIGAAVLVWVAAQAPAATATGAWGSLALLTLGSAGWLVIPVWLAMIRLRAADARAADQALRRHELDEQRLELAREVHDVVAHNLTVIGVQAGAALRVFDRNPETAREALDAIARTNRQALAELRGTVDLLRDPGATPAPGAPVPDLGPAGIGTLVESARRGGAAVTWTCTGAADDTSPAVHRAVHRIVQESLTNALRHAPGAAIEVVTAYEPGRLVVEVTDDGPGIGDAPQGRGITGMRERADAAGGTVSVTGDTAGGTTVRATFPAERAS